MQAIKEAAAAVQAADATLTAWHQRYAGASAYRLAEDLRLVRRYCRPGARILECGSAPLILTIALRRRGYDVVGLDIAPERFAPTIAAEALDVRRVNFETEPIPCEAGAFEAVLFNEVFEHLRINLIDTMSEVARVAAPGGRVFVSTPNMLSARGLAALLVRSCTCHVGPDLYEEYDRLRQVGHMGHVREYTAPELVRFLRRVGLPAERVLYRYPDRLWQPGWRGCAVRLAERAACAVAPPLRSLMSIVCRKPGAA